MPVLFLIALGISSVVINRAEALGAFLTKLELPARARNAGIRKPPRRWRSSGGRHRRSEAPMASGIIFLSLSVLALSGVACVGSDSDDYDRGTYKAASEILAGFKQLDWVGLDSSCQAVKDEKPGRAEAASMMEALLRVWKQENKDYWLKGMEDPFVRDAYGEALIDAC
jgi:hypothetical protein